MPPATPATARITRRPAALTATAAPAVLLVALGLGACSTASGVSAPTTTGTDSSVVTSSSSPTDGSCTSIRIEMESGSVPAPYNYRWTLTLQDSQGFIEAQGGERGAQTWTHEFEADAESRKTLCDYAKELTDQPDTDGVGGSTVHAEYTPTDGGPVSGADRVDGSDVPERMATALPDGVWSEVRQQLDTWSDVATTTTTG